MRGRNVPVEPETRVVPLARLVDVTGRRVEQSVAVPGEYGHGGPGRAPQRAAAAPEDQEQRHDDTGRERRQHGSRYATLRAKVLRLSEPRLKEIGPPRGACRAAAATGAAARTACVPAGRAGRP